MTVLLVDLVAAYRELAAEIDAAVTRVTTSGWYIGGTEVAAFEEAYADYCGSDHCVGVGNGFDALHLALRAMDIGSGHEVILASNSYFATVLAVSNVGAIPVFVEPDARTYNLDPQRIESVVTERTRAILPTHLYGQPADLDPILEIAKLHGLRVLEDAAQAHGARYKGERIGAHGDAVAWSFYPTKNLGAMGDAGAVTTNDAEIARRVRTLGNYGSSRKYVNPVRGVNSRLDPLHSAVLSVKLTRLDRWNDRRSNIAQFYTRQLRGSDITLPFVPTWADPAWHLFVIRSQARTELAENLAEAGIETLIHYPIPPHLQEAYSDLGIPRGSLPIAEELADTVLSLPIGPHISHSAAVEVVDAVLTTRSHNRLRR